MSFGVIIWKKQCAIDILGEEAFLPPPKISGTYPQNDDGTLSFFTEKSPERLARITFHNLTIEG